MITERRSPDACAIERAAALLRAGGLVAFPTETVYGLGANAFDQDAVHKIFAAKGRPSDNPLIVHVADVEAALPLCHISREAHILIDAFCPGPLTLLLPKTDRVLHQVNAGLPNVAIRIPSNPIAQALLRASRLPIAAPSANASGRPSPTTADHVYHDLQGKVPLILDGGPCTVGLESTVLDMTAETPTILRPGAITLEQLLAVLPAARVTDSVLRPLKQGEKACSPGMLYRHYAPNGKLVLVTGQPDRVRDRCLHLYRQATQEGIVAKILIFEEHRPLYNAYWTDEESGTLRSMGFLSHPETVARRLFSLLRRMDEDGAELILCEAMAPCGIGLAIMNRLRRAASFRMEDADQPWHPLERSRQ
ncbi:MAG: L-threonylcarbamoyladenylate synthase [Clostridia bacterium]|nr:L-threonylcarbamoyladenylate synthase [Clostridia bacterium]